MEDSGIMSQYRTDPNSPLEQLRKIVEPVTPQSLNAQIEALSDKKRQHLNMKWQGATRTIKRAPTTEPTQLLLLAPENFYCVTKTTRVF